MYRVITIFMMNLLLLTGCVALSKTSINNGVGASTQVVVTLNGVNNNKGKLLVFIHNNEVSYYSDANSDKNTITFYQMLKVPAESPQTKVIFNNIPAGQYAISAFHDEDEDGRLDRMIFPFMGMPKESYGSSNDSFSFLSKGSFEDALTDINAPITNITIMLSSHLSKISGSR